MPRIGHVDKTSDRPVTRYLSTGENYLLQLAAKVDTIDPDTGRKIPGKTMVARFWNNVFETNQPEIERLVEDSYAFKSGDIMKESELIKEAQERKFQEAKNLIAADPELIERLKKELREEVTSPEGRELSSRLYNKIAQEAVGQHTGKS